MECYTRQHNKGDYDMTYMPVGFDMPAMNKIRDKLLITKCTDDFAICKIFLGKLETALMMVDLHIKGVDTFESAIGFMALEIVALLLDRLDEIKGRVARGEASQQTVKLWRETENVEQCTKRLRKFCPKPSSPPPENSATSSPSMPNVLQYDRHGEIMGR